MDVSTWISLVVSIAFPALLIYWAINRFRQRHKNTSMSTAGLDGGMYQPDAVASSISWQESSNRVDEVAITFDIDAPANRASKPTDETPTSS